ncbi:MAG: aspartate carbamoyltransferase regulatory subunit [Gammaproteobacteria bacterium]|nr:aspartate carbamoyltransferase regulatory subunit [Gammaproteobacteria bacterium]
MKQLKVDAINNGTVIDHIPAGKALKVLAVIEPKPTDVVTVGVNFGSKTAKRKDILKFEGRVLTQAEIDRIAIVAHEATVNIISNFDVIKKFTIAIPDKIENLLDCPNSGCATVLEKIKTKFLVESRKPVKLRCYYCERVFEEKEIKI